MDDLSMIGNLGGLEILSFTGCGIKKLPSSIGQLKKLKLLDVSRCGGLRIDDGVLGGLVKLEELYMIGAFQNATISNCEELEKLCQKLTTLEIEFCGNEAQPKAVHFKNLKRFQISVGSYLYEFSRSFRNILRLEANKSEVLACEINGLFQTTEGLHLEVQGINHLGDVSGASDFSNLKFLTVEGCKELVHLVDATGGKPCNVFPVTESLFLSQLNNFEGICVGSPQHPMFKNLRVLQVFGCAKLKYVLSRSLSMSLVMLEKLEVGECKDMEEIVHEDDDEIIEAEVIMFPMLRVMELYGLPKLEGMSNSKSVVFSQLVELKLQGIPRVTSIYGGDEMEAITSAVQHLFRNKAATPMLEGLTIRSMESLREIWSPSQYHLSKDICTLRNMEVAYCDNLVNAFPTNLIRQLYHLETIDLKVCGSLEVIFDMNLECKESSNIHQNHENEQEEKGCSRLRTIYVERLHNLRHVWRMKGVNNSNDLIIQGFQALTSIKIIDCYRFQHLFTPFTINFNLGVLEDIEIKYGNLLRESGGSNNVLVESKSSNNQKVLTDQEMMVAATTFLPSHLIPTFQSLKSLCLSKYKMVEVVFDMESGSNRDFRSVNDQQLILPHLTRLKLESMDEMRHVWKLKKLSSLVLVPIPQKLLSFHNLTNIHLEDCGRVKYLLSPLMAKFLINLHTVEIDDCYEMEEIVSNRDDDGEGDQEMTTTFFPHLDTVQLHGLLCLKRIGGGGVGTNTVNSIATTLIDKLNAQVAVASWSFCQYSTKIKIKKCNALSSVIPCHTVGQLWKLEELEISDCESMEEVFEDEGSGYTALTIPMLEKMILDSLPRLVYIWRNKMLRFPNLTKLQISDCDFLRHSFTCSTVESLKQLKKLKIEKCWAMQVIVEEEDQEHTVAATGVIGTTSSKVLGFPNLQSLVLKDLQNLKGFSLGMHDFQWPVLEKVKIVGCPEMTVFTYGQSTTPRLKYIYSEVGKHILEGDLNFDRTPTSHETQFPTSGSSSFSPQFPWSLSNLIEKESFRDDLVNIFTSNELLQLQKLEKLTVENCESLLEVFEVIERTNNVMNEKPTAVKFPELREMDLSYLIGLRYIWKSHQWTVLEFPKLTEVSIVGCDHLQHVFTCSMVGSLVHLQELHISWCAEMQVIVKEGDVVEEDDEARSKEHVLPRLRSLKLDRLKKLKGFCLENDAFILQSLDTLEIKNCPEIAVFTSGPSTTPKLKVIDTDFGLWYAGEDPTTFIKTKIREGFGFEEEMSKYWDYLLGNVGGG